MGNVNKYYDEDLFVIHKYFTFKIKNRSPHTGFIFLIEYSSKF